MDEVLKSELHFQDHTEVLTHKVTQPSEGLILDRNAELRRNQGAVNDLGAKSAGGSWGRQVASIPFIIFEQAIREGYELNHRNQKHAGKEMNRFLQSDMGKTCLTTEKL